MSPKINEIVATLREYAPDKDGTQRYILIPAAGRGAIAEYPVTVRSHRTDIMRDDADLIEELQRELEVRRLQRWVNNKIIFGACKRFEDYKATVRESDDESNT